MLDTNVRQYVQPLFESIADWFIDKKVTANQVTIIALVIGLVPSILLLTTQWLVLPVIILWVSGLLDAVDGTVARKSGKSSLLGTIMDITFDRVVEISLLIGIAIRNPECQFLIMLLSCAIILSLTIFFDCGSS